jgi:murein DD-endopeptidase MepM/ murein hydrolase activator NlpD
MPLNTSNDTDPSVPTADPRTATADTLKSMAAGYRTQSKTSLNLQMPQPLWDDSNPPKRYFDGAPFPLKQLFAPPLAAAGTVAGAFLRGGKRIVSSGWGARRAGYLQEDGTRDPIRKHGGLDFTAKVGETVYASADGWVRFIGAQVKPTYNGGNRIPLTNVSVLANGDVTGLQSGTSITISASNLGYGGLYVEIAHYGDFQNYVTQYMHLSAIQPGLVVSKATPVKQGSPIGQVGTTGGTNTGNFALDANGNSHVHWQVHYLGQIVKPESLVPHYLAGEDQTALASRLPNVGTDPYSSNGASLVVRKGANEIQTAGRSTQAENQTYADHQTMASDFQNSLADKHSASASKVFTAIAQFEKNPPVVKPFMAFDFDNGVWNDPSPDASINVAGAGNGI